MQRVANGCTEMSTSSIFKTVSLPTFFADGFACAETRATSIAPAPVSPPVYLTGRTPSPSIDCPAPNSLISSNESVVANGITPSSGTPEDMCTLSGIAPSATSLQRLGPSGAWSHLSPFPDFGEAAHTVSNDIIEPPSHTVTLEVLLHDAIKQCYAAEDEAIRQQRETEDAADAGPPLSLTENTFEVMVATIRAQQRRRRRAREQMEDEARSVTRAKELPLLVQDAVRYAEQLVSYSTCAESSVPRASCSPATATANPADASKVSDGDTDHVRATTDKMLYARYPPPLFQSSSFAAGVARLLRWVRTWQRLPLSSPNTPSSSSSSSSPSSPLAPSSTVLLPSHAGDPNAASTTGKLSPLQQYYNDWSRLADRAGANSAEKRPPVSPEVHYGLSPTDQVMYDEHGNRLRSARLAQKMAVQRAVEHEAAKVRERRRGYFARDEEESSTRHHSSRRALFEETVESNPCWSDETSDGGGEDVTNIAVLHGPCGVGKTAAVYLVAAILGYRVVEMNTSVRRCPKNIDRLLAELTRSRRLSGLASAKATTRIEEELRKLKSEQAAQGTVKTNTSPLGKGATKPSVAAAAKKKKANAISAQAVAAFFKPRPQPTEIINVDVDPDSATVLTSHKPLSSRNNSAHVAARRDAAVTTKNAPTTPPAASSTSPASTSERKRPRETDTWMAQSENDDATRTLLLIEDADVILGDEAMRPFYAAVRDLAQRSKVPIVVTVSSPGAAPHSMPMSAAQAAHYFGRQTPFTGIDSLSRSALVVQLIVVAAVERGLLAPHPRRPAEDGRDHPTTSTSTFTIIPSKTTPSAVLVRNVAAWRRLTEVLRSEVYRTTDATHLDARLWLNRLQCHLLHPQWPNESDHAMDDDIKVALPHCFYDDKLFSTCSKWDAYRGRALQAPFASPLYVPRWEWVQFHYDASNAAGSIPSTDGSCNANSSTGLLPLHASIDGVPEDEPPVGFGKDEFTSLLQNLAKASDEGSSMTSTKGDTHPTTRDRMEVFGDWWRRTRRTDAARIFLAARSGRAYEDVIGFSRLLQPTQTGKTW